MAPHVRVKTVTKSKCISSSALYWVKLPLADACTRGIQCEASRQPRDMEGKTHIMHDFETPLGLAAVSWISGTGGTAGWTTKSAGSTCSRGPWMLR